MTRLLVDAMCGDLRAYLRMCGHDAAYAPDRGLETDEEVLAAADAESRVVLTRDRKLARRTDEAILLESQDTERQLASLLDAGVELELAAEPQRCGRCNGAVTGVETGETTAEYAPDPGEERVWECVDCGRYFWRGSHWDRVGETLSRVRRGSVGDG